MFGYLLLAYIATKLFGGEDDKPAAKDKGSPWDFGKGSDVKPERKLPGTNKPIPKVPDGKPVAAQGGVAPGLASHMPYPAPIPPQVVATAKELLTNPKLAPGNVVRGVDPGGKYPYVAYRKEPHGGGKTGITAYVPKFDAGGATGKW